VRPEPQRCSGACIKHRNNQQALAVASVSTAIFLNYRAEVASKRRMMKYSPGSFPSLKFGWSQDPTLVNHCRKLAVLPPDMNEIGCNHPTDFPAATRQNTPVIIFVTVCTHDRKQILATGHAHELLRGAWQNRTRWLVGRYIVMPDHVHLFCAPAAIPTQPMHPWVSFWKSRVAMAWAWPQQIPIWQLYFWDTQLRPGESYDERWEYVFQNPVRAGLVKNARDWPHQGELNVLEW
jgi:putative transposase